MYFRTFSFFLIISSILFLRGDIEFLSIIGIPASIINILSILIGIFLFFRFSFINNNLYLLLYFLFISSFLNIFLQLIFNSPNIYFLVLFTFELILNLLLLIIGFSTWNYLNFKIISLLHVISGIFFSIPIFTIVLFLDKVRRIGAGGEEDSSLPVAVNHLGHSLVISCIFAISLLFLTNRYKILKLFTVILLASAAFFTGSKAAILGFIPLIFFIILINFKKGFTTFIFLTSSFFIFLYSYGDKFLWLLNRFTFDSILLGINQRIKSFTNSINSSPDSFSLIGWADHYQLINNIEPIIYPHNILLSFYLHLGLIPSLTLLAILIYFLIKFFSLSNFSIYDALMFSIFCTVIFYTFTSGRLTRIMTLPFYFGLIAGYLKNRLMIINESKLKRFS